MTPEELVKKLENMPIALEKWVNGSGSADAPTVFGKTAVDFFTENFNRQGFLNNGLHKWQNVKRRMNPKITGAAILTGATGNLKRGISYTPGIGQVLIYNDARSSKGFAYAAVHNQGTDSAGRNHATVIPKRQFMGDSAELSKLLNSEIVRKLKEISK